MIFFFFQYDDTKINIDIDIEISNDPTFGALHYDETEYNCEVIQVFYCYIFEIKNNHSIPRN